MENNKEILERIASALERISPPSDKYFNLDIAEGFVFDPKNSSLKPVGRINRIPIKLLKGLENQKEILFKNTENFSKG